MIRKSILDALDLDIIRLAETHLRRCKNIEFDGYTWFGNNRKDIHRKAPKGSGGVGVLIRNCVLNQFNVYETNTLNEGIIWVRLKDKETLEILSFCVCYVPPSNSTRNVNVEEFLNVVMSDVYVYQTDSALVLVCGDFNIRVGDEDDLPP